MIFFEEKLGKKKFECEKISNCEISKSLNQSISNLKINRFRGYYENRKSYSICYIAECINAHYSFLMSHGRPLTAREFIAEAKIGSKDLVCKIINKIKCNINTPGLNVVIDVKVSCQLLILI